jgi:hypothetical protein
MRARSGARSSPGKKNATEVRTAEPAALPAEILVARYEELRETFTGSAAAPGRSLGLALLLRSGLAAWMETVAALPATSARGAPVLDERERLPMNLRGELTSILATMALSAASEQGGPR